MSDDEYREYLKHVFQRLTPAGRRLLLTLAEYPDEWLTRRRLASLKGKSYLMRYDIKLLDQLVAAGLIEQRRERIADAYGEIPPRKCKGNQISLWSFYHSYRLLPGLAHYLKPKPRQAARPRQAVKPLATVVHYDSPLDWLLVKVGFRAK